MSGVRTRHGTDRDGTSILVLTFDFEIFLTGAVLSLNVGAINASAYAPCLGTVDGVT